MCQPRVPLPHWKKITNNFLGCPVRLGERPFLQTLPNDTYKNAGTFSLKEFFIVVIICNVVIHWSVGNAAGGSNFN